MTDPVLLTKELEQKITIAKQELYTYQLLLRKVKKEQNRSFAQSKFGKVWFKSLAAMTKPFARWHQKAHEYATNPMAVRTQKLISYAQDLLLQSGRIEPNHPAVIEQLRVLTQLVIEIEDHVAENPEFALDCEDYLTWLKDEVTRLRPPVDESKLAAMQASIEQVIQGLEIQRTSVEVK
jgi:hypothetical protein